VNATRVFWEIIWLRKWVLLGSLIIALFLVLVFPDVLAIYYLETGARYLAKSLDSTDVDGQEMAIQHLERAVKWDKRNDQAYRLLGQAFMAQGQLIKAAQAYSVFTELRPEHELGRLELAATYRAIKDALRTMLYADLVVQVEQATTSEPLWSAPHPFEPSDYVHIANPTLFSNHRPAPALFLHPVSAITYTLTLTQPAFLRFGMGNVLHGLESGSDGITFEVYVNDQRLFFEHLTPDMSQSEWQEREVDLSRFTGQTISLKLMTTPGPAGDITADWAVWGWPRVEAPEAKTHRDFLEQAMGH
jgi:hypothetical protein